MRHSRRDTNPGRRGARPRTTSTICRHAARKTSKLEQAADGEVRPLVDASYCQTLARQLPTLAGASVTFRVVSVCCDQELRAMSEQLHELVNVSRSVPSGQLTGRLAVPHPHPGRGACRNCSDKNEKSNCDSGPAHRFMRRGNFAEFREG
jgi:hypothetical protein